MFLSSPNSNCKRLLPLFQSRERVNFRGRVGKNNDEQLEKTVSAIFTTLFEKRRGNGEFLSRQEAPVKQNYPQVCISRVLQDTTSSYLKERTDL